MPHPFTSEQMETIRCLLFESACRHAASTGVKKTSLEALTADAGISKSTFYKFYKSKEQLFAEVAFYFERLIIAEMKHVLKQTTGLNNRERTAAAVNAAFDKLKQLDVLKFLTEDVSLLAQHFWNTDGGQHFRSMALTIVEALSQEGIRFAMPEGTVCAIIQILYLSVQQANEVDDYPNALKQLVLCACDRLVEETA